MREETHCRHIDYSFQLTARVPLYAPSHRQDSTYQNIDLKKQTKNMPSFYCRNACLLVCMTLTVILLFSLCIGFCKRLVRTTNNSSAFVFSICVRNLTFPFQSCWKTVEFPEHAAV